MFKLKAKVNKETFKLSMKECVKKAWIWDNKENFASAVNWKKDRILEIDADANFDDENEFSDSAESIDIFSAYLNIESLNESEKEEFLKKWNSAWDSETGFDPELFAGETIEDGNAFGEKVREYFDMKNIIANDKRSEKKLTANLDELKFFEAEKKTKELLEENKCEYIYEAAFSFDDEKIRTRCDVLKIKDNKHVEIIEAKATTKVKAEHFFDLMYQVFVLEKCGFIVDDICIAKINSDYVMNSDLIITEKTFGDQAKEFINKLGKIKYEEIKDFVKSDFTVEYDNEPIEVDLNKLIYLDYLTYGKNAKRPTLKDDLKAFREKFDLDQIFMNLSNHLNMKFENGEIPEFLHNKKCTLNYNKDRAGNWDHGFNHDEYDNCFHVMNWFDKDEPGFWNIGKFKRAFKSHVIRNSKSPYFKDYESLFEPSIVLNKKGESFFQTNRIAKRMFEVYNLKKQYPEDESKWRVIDLDNLEWINSLLSVYENYPIYMYDFETSKWAIPRFNLVNTYYQTPFQYSIDVIVDNNYDYNKPETMKHYSFLSSEQDTDPRIKFIENFIKDSFKHGPGVYVAYNKSFEQGVLRKLAMMFPKYAKPLAYIIQNTVDLMDFFTSDTKGTGRPAFLIYHPYFKGSYSIKKTQPSLDPSFSYNDLVINKGDKASETFRKFVDGRIPKAAWDLKVKEGMLKYCDRDTLAMVVILKKVKELVEAHNGKN
ncbi:MULTISPECIES: DUF2779 domain-containing protein [Mesoplasma]|uniref:DUF2779 domain-containing protein n=1 Tax=Mesoplasma florum TaxID=2151 RepID=A0A2R3P7K4_MESFO|nr:MULTISPECIES: DUF2779 domain-containing protein [Mesoplasma]AVN64467.1 DUF2779 domain-containing protein [Mesoplasma florum]